MPHSPTAPTDAFTRPNVPAARSASEVRYEPLPRPEEVDRWIRFAYLAGVEYGRRLSGDPQP